MIMVSLDHVCRVHFGGFAKYGEILPFLFYCNKILFFSSVLDIGRLFPEAQKNWPKNSKSCSSFDAAPTGSFVFSCCPEWFL